MVTSTVVSSTGISKVVFSVKDTTMEFRGKGKDLLVSRHFRPICSSVNGNGDSSLTTFLLSPCEFTSFALVQL